MPEQKSPSRAEADPVSGAMCRVGADVGGTFTDVLVQSDSGQASIRKVLSTPPAYDRAVVEAISEILNAHSETLKVAEIIHGTTVATNSVLQRRGSRIALVTTEGFRDVLELRRLRTPHMYDAHWKKPPRLVERDLRYEFPERCLADGEVVKSPDPSDIATLAKRLTAAKVEAVAICFLHSYLYPDHERIVGSALQSLLPGIALSLSSDIIREQGEYERTATAVVNAYVMPLMAGYLGRIKARLAAIGISSPLMIMKSSGGLMTDEDAARRPVFILESGPAAGVIATLGVAELLGHKNAIAFDMGGTTAKASLIESGRISLGREYEVGGDISTGSRLIRGSGELLRIPTIDIAEVGAGGGSIAWVDAAGGLHVGPESAGANPGPACYGRGGLAPTVTDANVVLGYMRTGPIGDGQLSISEELAEAAVGGVAERLGLSIVDTARGIHELANARMMRALRAVSSERGRDPRGFVLVAYGGAGPIHAVGLAFDLGVETVLVPPLAGVFSAVGLLFAKPEVHDVRTCDVGARSCDPELLNEFLREMKESLGPIVGDWDTVTWTPTADLRYRGQSWEVEVELPAQELSAGALDVLIARFEDEHERLYGVRGSDGAVTQIRAVRLSASGAKPRSQVFGIGSRQSTPEVEAHDTPRLLRRRVHFPHDSGDVSVRARLDIATRREPGPQLIDEYDTTIVVPGGWSVRREEQTNSLVLERSGSSP